MLFFPPQVLQPSGDGCCFVPHGCCFGQFNVQAASHRDLFLPKWRGKAPPHPSSCARVAQIKRGTTGIRPPRSSCSDNTCAAACPSSCPRACLTFHRSDSEEFSLRIFSGGVGRMCNKLGFFWFPVPTLALTYQTSKQTTTKKRKTTNGSCCQLICSPHPEMQNMDPSGARPTPGTDASG